LTDGSTTVSNAFIVSAKTKSCWKIWPRTRKNKNMECSSEQSTHAHASSKNGKVNIEFKADKPNTEGAQQAQIFTGDKALGRIECDHNNTQTADGKNEKANTAAT
jgi:hypothetical protein